jgi:hypothetical protein
MMTIIPLTSGLRSGVGISSSPSFKSIVSRRNWRAAVFKNLSHEEGFLQPLAASLSGYRWMSEDSGGGRHLAKLLLCRVSTFNTLTYRVTVQFSFSPPLSFSLNLNLFSPSLFYLPLSDTGSCPCCRRVLKHAFASRSAEVGKGEVE